MYKHFTLSSKSAYSIEVKQISRRLERKLQWRLIDESCSCLLVPFMTCSSNLQKMAFMDCFKTTLSSTSTGVGGGKNCQWITVDDCNSDSDNAEETSITWSEIQECQDHATSLEGRDYSTARITEPDSARVDSGRGEKKQNSRKT